MKVIVLFIGILVLLVIIEIARNLMMRCWRAIPAKDSCTIVEAMCSYRQKDRVLKPLRSGSRPIKGRRRRAGRRMVHSSGTIAIEPIQSVGSRMMNRVSSFLIRNCPDRRRGENSKMWVSPSLIGWKAQ